MAPREGTVTVNGLRLHYLDWGGEGPAIVLHHATSLHAWVWHPIAQRLVARGRVLAYDARGHGDSDKPASDYGWDRFARDLVGFIEALQLGPATLVGHSSGGTAALACAAWRPELVTRIVALEPVLVPPQVEGASLATDSSRRAPAAAGPSGPAWKRQRVTCASGKPTLTGGRMSSACTSRRAPSAGQTARWS